MTILTFNINKTNTYKLCVNKRTQYVIGLGLTNYTIHRDADDIQKIYNNKYCIFKNWTTKSAHSYHVFRSTLLSIVDKIKWKDIIKHQGKSYKVIKSYIGIPNITEIVYQQGYGRTSHKFIENGVNIVDLDEQLKYVIECEEINN